MDSDEIPGAAVRCSAQFEYPSYVFDAAQKVLCVASIKAKAQELTRAPVDICAVIDRHVHTSAACDLWRLPQ